MACSRKPLTEEALARYAEDKMDENSDDSSQNSSFESADGGSESGFSDNSESEPNVEESESEFTFETENDCIMDMDTSNLNWISNVENLTRLMFTGSEGIQFQFPATGPEGEITPPDIFFTIIDDKVIQLMVTETNRYANCMKKSKKSTQSSRINRWKDIDSNTMKKFLGIILFMGLVRYPKIEYYWKKNDIYYHPLLHKIGMSYNRFSAILRCWHFVDNSLPTEDTDRLFKINPLINLVMDNIKKLYIPGDTVVIDETMILFRGRLKFRQYNPSKAHKYGMKVYKLCTPRGFVWSFQVYSGQDSCIDGLDKPGSIVINLGKELLNEGRLFITDKFYTSIPLALYLKEHNTDLCGTLRKNRKDLPKEILVCKLKKGEVIAKQASDITIIKWRDKRDVLMLSTCHGKDLTETTTDRAGNPVLKPKIIEDYNKGKQGIDLSDQMSSYYSALRKSLTWYKKIAVELVFGTVLVNSGIIYNELHSEKPLRQLQFVENLIDYLVVQQDVETSTGKNNKKTHQLKEIPRKKNGIIIRKRCHECYEKIRKSHNPSYARKNANKFQQNVYNARKHFA